MTYGSGRDLDNENWDRILVTCSPDCRAKLVADGRIPADARLLPA